ncbi:MAG: IS1634 family transposase [Thermodesulfobacteriota bacterium]
MRGQKMVPAAQAFVTEEARPHGHVWAVLGLLRKIGLDQVLAAKPCRERDLVVAMIAARLIHPCSKLATTRSWSQTTLAQELGAEEADEDELYQALDWLAGRQERIEKKLAARHLTEGGQALYDLSSSYYEGRTCPLARYGHSRDGKKGRPIIVYGVMTDQEGRPVSVRVYPGNTGDPTTVPEQAEKLREKYGLDRVVLVGDRGLLTQTQLDHLKKYPGLGWISALRFESVRRLVEEGPRQLSLFDRQNLAEISSPAFPGERLVACFNPLLAEERGRKREELLQATEAALSQIVREAARRRKTPLTQAEIGRKVGRVLGRFRMGKHFDLDIGPGTFSFRRNEVSIRREADLDGLYVIRTSEPPERLSAPDAMRSYKSLAQVEKLFRTFKSIDLKVRPIHHRDETRVKAHIFLCLLAYYLEWHMRAALAPLLFDDEELGRDRKRRDPVAPARPSLSALHKKRRRITAEGLPVQSFQTLLAHLATWCRVRCRVDTPTGAAHFHQLTQKTPLVERAFELLGL